jgi:long-chain acyl-CoA synthetase
VITVDGTVTTYGELRERVNRLSNLILQRGVGSGDHLAFLIGNTVSAYEVALACVQLGVIYTPINRRLTGGEAGYIVQDCGARMFIAEATFAETAREVAGSLASDPDGPQFLAIGDIPGFDSLEESAAACSDALPARDRAGAPFYYTSGTTGRPKGVLRPGSGEQPLADVLHGFVGVAIANGCPREGTYLVQGPLHHSGPLGGSLNVLHAGATAVLMNKWDARVCLEMIDRHQVWSTLMVPTMFHRLLAVPADVRARYDVSSIRVVKHGSAPCPVPVKRAMIEWFGPVLMETYGGQEGVVATVDSQDWLAHPGTVGRVDPTRVRILDEDGKPCPTGTVGTIYAALGDVAYFHDPAKTAGSRRGEFFTLGDLGYLDEDHWLYLVDRRVDLIVSGGVNIYPAEVEAALLQHPDVADAGVIAVANDEWGQEVRAVVQLRAEVAVCPGLDQELIDFCRQRIARFKCPRSVVFVDAPLPRDALGKLQRGQVRQDHGGALAADAVKR